MLRADFREGDEDSNSSVFRDRRLTGSLKGPDLFTELPSFGNPHQTPH